MCRRHPFGKNIITHKFTEISPADPDLRASFLNHFTMYVDKENARKMGISAIYDDV
jgi:hypothetical protein